MSTFHPLNWKYRKYSIEIKGLFFAGTSMIRFKFLGSAPILFPFICNGPGEGSM